MADLVGTAGNDVLRINPGGPFYDRFFGLAGDDLLIARGSDPINGMYGGEGNDTYSINSRFGPNVFENVGEGYDVVYISADLYSLRAGQEIELMLIEDAVSTFPSSLFGNEFAQSIAGNNGQNEIYGRGGADTYVGRGGNDLYHIVDARTWIIEGANEGTNDVAYTTVDYVLSSGSYVEVLTVEPGLTAAINLTGNELRQAVVGNDAANILNGNGGADTLQGKGGDDTYLVGDSSALVWEAANGGYDTVYSRVNFTLGENEHVERLLADDAAATTALTLRGNNLAQVIAGNAGANLIVGGGGADTLIGRGGDDTYGVSDVSARIWEDVGGGYDTVYSTVSYALERTREIEVLLIDDAAATTALNLTGNEFAQVIAGNAGANFIAGRGGADILIGRGGDDSYLITDAAALVWEDVGEGNDSVFTTVSYTLEVTREIERLLVDDAASTDALNLTGNEFAQVIAGNAGANFIAGRGGADILIGRGGNDSYLITDAAARVWEDVGGGSDTVFTTVSYALEATREIERLVIDDAASSNALNLTGNEFAQVVAGNAGANVLDGKGGADTLVGRGGADSFAFTTTLGSGNVDWIFDFELVTDQILLDDAVFTGLGLGALSANAFVIGSAAADADDRIIYNSGTGALFFDADGVGGAAAVQFATMSTGLAMTASEFTVI